ncbi:MAG: 23S rRNA (guanosine(2251)-2'-O)-methyltransferase RlmB, partial [Chloroflexota bacterium]|nr:23S rRNA (guanosine(2251)-2'-O)-methyltransferase RlmB [Chloroflexota bacterium]
TGFAPGGGRGFRDDDRRPRPSPGSRSGGFGGGGYGGGAYDRGARTGPPGRPERPGFGANPDRELLFGRNAILEALRAGRKVRRVMVALGAHGAVITEIVDEARARGISVQSMERRRLDELVFNHQGVVAEADPYQYASLEDLIEATKRSATPPLVLVLDTLQDPQNFGSLLRTAAAVVAHGAIIPEHRAVGVTPAVVKASAGAIERLTIARVGNIVQAIEALKVAGLWIVGLDARAELTPGTADLGGPLAIVVGGEEKGLRPLVRQACDLVVSLPMPGQIESLNAAVAGSVVLYEVLRQRGRATTGQAARPRATLAAPMSDVEPGQSVAQPTIGNAGAAAPGTPDTEGDAWSEAGARVEDVGQTEVADESGLGSGVAVDTGPEPVPETAGAATGGEQPAGGGTEELGDEHARTTHVVTSGALAEPATEEAAERTEGAQA